MIHIYERHISWLHAALLNSNESLSNTQQWLPFSLVNALCEAVAVCAYCFVSKQINSIILQVKSRSQYTQFVRDSVLPCFNYTLCGFTVFECGFFWGFFFAPLTKWFTWTSSWIPAQKQTQENTCQSMPPLQPTTVQWVMVRLQI